LICETISVRHLSIAVSNFALAVFLDLFYLFIVSRKLLWPLRGDDDVVVRIVRIVILLLVDVVAHVSCLLLSIRGFVLLLSMLCSLA
jgi:hypothetical protein